MAGEILDQTCVMVSKPAARFVADGGGEVPVDHRAFPTVGHSDPHPAQHAVQGDRFNNGTRCWWAPNWPLDWPPKPPPPLRVNLEGGPEGH